MERLVLFGLLVMTVVVIAVGDDDGTHVGRPGSRHARSGRQAPFAA